MFEDIAKFQATEKKNYLLWVFYLSVVSQLNGPAITESNTVKTVGFAYVKNSWTFSLKLCSTPMLWTTREIWQGWRFVSCVRDVPFAIPMKIL